jgi:hypothetical protein
MFGPVYDRPSLAEMTGRRELGYGDRQVMGVVHYLPQPVLAEGSEFSVALMAGPDREADVLPSAVPPRRAHTLPSVTSRARSSLLRAAWQWRFPSVSLAIEWHR